MSDNLLRWSKLPVGSIVRLDVYLCMLLDVTLPHCRVLVLHSDPQGDWSRPGPWSWRSGEVHSVTFVGGDDTVQADQVLAVHGDQ